MALSFRLAGAVLLLLSIASFTDAASCSYGRSNACTANYTCCGCRNLSGEQGRCCLTTKTKWIGPLGHDTNYCFCEPWDATPSAEFEQPALTRNYTEIQGGDCCPGITGCKGGTGPFAVSTGGDYPEMSKPRCDGTPGCVAFGQMYKYVTHFHFASKAACLASAQSNVSLGDYYCDEGPVSPVAISEYRSVTPMHAKMPYTCYTSSRWGIRQAAKSTCSLGCDNEPSADCDKCKKLLPFQCVEGDRSPPQECQYAEYDACSGPGGKCGGGGGAGNAFGCDDGQPAFDEHGKFNAEKKWQRCDIAPGSVYGKCVPWDCQPPRPAR